MYKERHATRAAVTVLIFLFEKLREVAIFVSL